MSTTYIFISAGIISLLSLGGIILAIKTLKHWFFKNASLLVTFAAGVFIMTSIGIIGETFEFLPNTQALLSITIGFLGMLVLHKIIPETHQHEGVSCDTCIVSKKSGSKIIVGDIIHNTADGIILVAAFSISTQLGIITALSIAVHEFIQEISEYIVLRNSGYSVRKSLTLNFISALSIFVGVLVGLFLTQDTGTQAILLGISGGAFLHVVFHDLIPYNSLPKTSSQGFATHSLVFGLGILIMFAIGQLAPHTHEHEEETHMHENAAHDTYIHNHHYEKEHTH